VYDTVIGHSQQDNPEQLLLQIDGGGGTGKSYLIKILAAHLRQANREETVALAAPTGVASSNIRGKTIHSLLDYLLIISLSNCLQQLLQKHSIDFNTSNI